MFAPHRGMLVVGCLVGMALGVTTGQAQTPTRADTPASSWIGKTVVVLERLPVPLKEEARVVGQINDTFIHVEKEQGDWIWVHTGENKKGWIKKSQVALLADAEERLSQRIRANPGDHYALYLRAHVLLDRWAAIAALGDIDEALRLSPNTAQYHIERAQVHHNLGKYDEALGDLARAVQLAAPGQLTAIHLSRGSVLIAQKKYDQALAEFNRVIDREPDLAWGYEGRASAYVWKKEPLLALREFSQARRRYPEVRYWSLDPNDFDDMFATDAQFAMWAAVDELSQSDEATILRFQPQDAEDYAVRASLWTKKKLYPRAVQDFEQAIRLTDEPVSVQRELGLVHFLAGDYTAAIAAYDLALQPYPKWTDALNERGLARLALGDTSAALAEFDVVLSNSQLDDALLNRGWIKFRQGRFAEALADYVAARKLVHFTLKNGKGFPFHQGFSYRFEELDVVPGAENFDGFVLAVRADGYMRAKKDAEALADLDESIRLDPKFALPHFLRGEVRFNQKNYAAAADDYSQAIALQPDYAEALFRRAGARENIPDFPGVIADYAEAVRLKYREADSLNGRGWGYYKKNDLDRAMADYAAAIRLDPKHYMAYNNRACVWLDKKEYRKAIDDCNEAIKYFANYSFAHNNRGLAQKGLGNYALAQDDFEKAIKFWDQNDNAVANLAWLLATCPDSRYRDGKRAVELATKALSMVPTRRVDRLTTLAAAYAEAGQFTTAVELQQEALSQVAEADRAPYEARLKLFQAKTPYHEERRP